MRLICPNCGAQYAVDERVIPDAGRDVQCSNCGHTWFQQHPDFDSGLAAEMGFDSAPAEHDAETTDREVAPTSAPAAIPDPAPATRPAPVEETVSQVTPEPAPGSGSDAPEAGSSVEEQSAQDAPAAEPEADDPALSAAPQRQRRKLDEDVMAVLREEAAREQAARAAETGAPPEEHPAAETTRIAPLPEPASPDTHPPTELETRRDLLPDIEEINSTLSPSDHGTLAETGETEAEFMARIAARRRGRRIGFGLVLVIFGVATTAYVQGPRLAQLIPGLQEPLVRYVATVDQGRIWLDQLVVTTFGDGDG